jgi:catechol-2,3-dioxygenase
MFDKELTMKATNYEEGRQTPKSLVGLRHVGLSAQNPAALADFYHVVLGLDIVPTDTGDTQVGTTLVRTASQ